MVKTIDVPDSARSWAVAVAGCLINSLMTGLTRSTGLMYVSLVDIFGASRYQANLPFSARVIVKNLGGPIVGALGQRFGPRNVTLVGGVLSSVGMLLCAFAPNIMWITIFCGAVHGFGVSMASTLGLIMVTQWFMEYKATGTGLAFSGSCLGSLFLPIFIENMLENFGLFGCFLVTSGLILHVLPAAFIMKEPSWMQMTTKKKTIENDIQILNRTKVIEESNPNRNDLEVRLELHRLPRNLISKTTYQQENFTLNERNVLINPPFAVSTANLKNFNVNQKEESKCSREKMTPVSQREAEVQQETSLFEAVLIIICDPMFYMISISLATYAVVLDPVFIVLVDFMRDKGFSENVSKYFISAFALGDLLGRLSFGWVTDRKFVSVKTFMMLMQVSHGAFFILMPIFSDFWLLLLIVTLFGIITGASLIMIPILVQTYLPSVQSLAVGCISFVSGIAILMVPSLIGYFRDEIGSYNGMIFVTGGVAMIVGSLWGFEPLLLRLKSQLSKGNEVKTIPTC